ncbi:hypothetical protein M758_6G077600 [Ceratodon purpureus]|nr:hypothetical protein M758_6G077600 [Ceratodon purpureus]
MEVPQHWAEAQRFNNATLGHDRPTASKSEHFVVEFLLSAAVFAVVNLVFQRLHMQGFRQPPRPSAWKFLFQIYVLRRNPTVVLHNLVKQHGPVIRVRLWSQDLLVLSSVAAVEEFYKLHDAEFGARPTSMNRATLTNSVSSLCFPPLATYWHHLRFVLDMTTSTAFDNNSTPGIAWALEALIRQHPAVVERLCDELEQTQADDDDEPDIAKMPYLQVVVKELFRLHPPCAFSFPHESSEEYHHLLGFEVAPRTQVLINIYALQRDPSAWANAEDFDPTRFIAHPEVDMEGHHFQLVPFGGGIRQCPGTKLAIRYVQSGIAQYFQHARLLEWKFMQQISR